MGRWDGKTAFDRFREKYDVDEGGCWLWLGATTVGGYPSFYYEGRLQLGHRVAYRMFVGVIPDGLHLDHLCSVRRCVNPSHLEPVTCLENVRRAAALVTHCPRGHEYDEANTVVYRGMRKCRTCHRDRERARRARSQVAA